MKEKDFLFHLIKSLTATERGYFTKFGFKNNVTSEDKLQLLLFARVCKQKEYDEEELKEKFFQRDPNKFRIVKHHLYNRIINSLIEYGKDSSIESVVWKNLSAAKVLIGKALYKSAEKFALN